MKLKGLIFDFDGLIIDTETPAYVGLKRVYAKYGLELKETTFGKIVGTDDNDEFHPYHSLAKTLPDGSLSHEAFEAMYDIEKEREYEAMIVLPGVREMIAEARRRGLKTAIASSSHSTWVKGYLPKFGLQDSFDEIITCELVKNVKPEPDLFLLAQSKLGFAKDEVVIFEDSFNGVIAANRAGIHVVLIPNPVTIHLPIKGESLRVASMADLTLERLDDLLRNGHEPN